MKKKITLACLIITASFINQQSFSQWQLTGNNNATSSSVLGTTNSVPLNIITKNTSRIFIDTLGRIGLGTTLPQNILTVKTSGGSISSKFAIGGSPIFAGFGETGVGNSDYVLSMASNTFNARPVMITRRSRGTLAAPAAVVANDYIGSLLATGYDGTNFQNSAAIDFFVDGTPTSGNVPVRLSLVTGTNGGNRTERLKVLSNGDFNFNSNQMFLQKSTGRFGIGTVTPAALLDVAGTIRIANGTQAAGRVLTSDANGVASWSSNGLLPAGTAGSTLRHNGASWVANTLLYNNGSGIGIGETSPQGVLHVSQPFNFAGIVFTGTGLNDLSADNSSYTGTGTTNYSIRIENAGPDPNMIEVSTDGGATWAAPQPIANPISLANGVTASFANTTGHTFGDRWDWTVSPSYLNNLVVNNGKVAIGQAVASAILDVNGDALINGVAAGRGKSNIVTNTRFGSNAFANDKSGHDNTAIGYYSLTNDSAGSYNAAVGVRSLYQNGGGSYNSAFGVDALYSNTTGTANTAVGSLSLYSNIKGSNNTGVGLYALFYDTAASFNTSVGLSAGDYTTEPSFATFLGYHTTASSTLTNVTVIGNGANTTASNSVRVGNSAVTSIGGQVGWTNFSDARFKQNVQENVPGLTFIKKLRPVTYNLNVEGIDKFYLDNNPVKDRKRPEPTAAEKAAKQQKSKIQYTGFLAQEVEAAAKELKYDFSGVDAPKNDKDYYGLRYAEFVVPLVKAVQELSKENEDLKAKANKVDDLQKQIDELKEALIKISAAKAPCTTSR